jgi:tetratricopeptide (TPR) repeat protein
MRRYLRLLVWLGSVPVLSCSGEHGPEAAQAPAPAAKSDLEILLDQVRTNPRDAGAWFHLADLYERANLYQEEADALEQVIALDPKMGYAYVKLGTTCNRLGAYQRAVESFERAEKYVARLPVLYNNLALSYGKLGKTDAQVAALRKAIALRPSYATAHYNLGMALLARGDREGARKEQRTLQDLDEGAAASLKKEIDAPRAGR